MVLTNSVDSMTVPAPAPNLHNISGTWVLIGLDSLKNSTLKFNYVNFNLPRPKPELETLV